MWVILFGLLYMIIGLLQGAFWYSKESTWIRSECDILVSIIAWPLLWLLKLGTYLGNRLDNRNT